ncbi:hypothetical protein C2G38_2142657 [Gigaspora rosea]|uniref:Uncharacterized protein n=1 Tax=Gigaspora rosea TaxID=44941 RepID=A0A397V445_9GLOM|nr:hypothetical protein C2G38_2142657 [Gigaspora rosea]
MVLQNLIAPSGSIIINNSNTSIPLPESTEIQAQDALQALLAMASNLNSFGTQYNVQSSFKTQSCQYDFFDLTKICNKCDSTCERKIAAWERGKYPKEIVGPFEFGEYRELEGSKQNKKDINEYKADEYESGIESNDILLYENKTLLEIFKANKDKILYYKSYETMTRIYNDLQKEKKRKKKIKEQQKSYYKGDENKFRNMCWDIKYCIGEDGIEKTIEESKKFNQNIEGEHIVDGDNLYWRKKFPEFKKNYLRDYPKAKKYFIINKNF